MSRELNTGCEFTILHSTVFKCYDHLGCPKMSLTDDARRDVEPAPSQLLFIVSSQADTLLLLLVKMQQAMLRASPRLVLQRPSRPPRTSLKAPARAHTAWSLQPGESMAALFFVGFGSTTTVVPPHPTLAEAGRRRMPNSLICAWTDAAFDALQPSGITASLLLVPSSPPCIDPRWCAANPEACKLLRPVDLTGAIGAKRLCSVASHDFDSEQTIDLCILGHGGVHLVFESEGTAAPLDSPSRLYVTVRVGAGGQGR